MVKQVLCIQNMVCRIFLFCLIPVTIFTQNTILSDTILPNNYIDITFDDSAKQNFETTYPNYGKGTVIKTFDKKLWEEITRDLEYAEKKKIKKSKSSFWTKFNDKLRNFFKPISKFFAQIFEWFAIMFSAVFKALPWLKYVLLGLLAGLLIYFLVRLITGQAKNKSKVNEIYVHVDNLDEYIHDVDLWDFLHNNIQHEKYKEGIRILFLICIKELSNHNKILWRKEKTNRDYLLELSTNTELYNAFKKLVYVYEWVWYGNQNIDKIFYEEWSVAFLQFIKQKIHG